MPAYNEEHSIRRVINEYLAIDVVDELVVVDNNARGRTPEEIDKTDAIHVVETKQGYGHALMRGLKEASGDLILMTEGDGAFRAEDIHKFLLYSDDFDVVLGTRTSRATIWTGAFMPFSVRLGNWAVAKFLEFLYDAPTLTDVGCTYKLLSKKVRDSIEDLFKYSPGGADFSPELIIWIVRRRIKTVEIPVILLPRVGRSHYTGTVLRAAMLGFKMLWLITKYRFRKI